MGQIETSLLVVVLTHCEERDVIALQIMFPGPEMLPRGWLYVHSRGLALDSVPSSSSLPWSSSLFSSCRYRILQRPYWRRRIQHTKAVDDSFTGVHGFGQVAGRMH